MTAPARTPRFRRRPAGFAITRETLTELYGAHATAILMFVARRVLDAQTAADLTAETFAQAYTHRAQFRGATEDEALGWLYGIARHQVSHFHRRGKAEARALAKLGLERPELSDAEIERIEEAAGIAALAGQVAGHLEALSADQQQALRLRVLEEQSYDEMATTLGLTEEAVRARVSRGLRTLARRLNAAEELA